MTRVTDAMVNRFLSWPLPESVCSDECVTRTAGEWTPEYPQRTGTNLLTADEARKMLEYVLGEYTNRCPHEWYQGRCVHCDVQAKDGKPAI